MHIHMHIYITYMYIYIATYTHVLSSRIFESQTMNTRGRICPSSWGLQLCAKSGMSATMPIRP